MNTFLKFLSLLLIVTTTIVAVPALGEATTTNLSTTITANFLSIGIKEALELLASLWFIAWLIESLLEILLKILAIDKKPNTGKSVEVEKFAALGGLIMGLLVAISGVHTIGIFFKADPSNWIFRYVDIVLTAGVLAGGSKGIHELTNAYKKIIENIPKLT